MQSGIARARPGDDLSNVTSQALTIYFTMVIVYSCLSEVIVLSRSTTRPPPSTVSIVRARRLGVIASKS